MNIACQELVEINTIFANSIDSANNTGIDTQQLAPAISPKRGTKTTYLYFPFMESIDIKIEVTSMEIKSPNTILYNDKSMIKLGLMKIVIVGLNTKDKPRLEKLRDSPNGVVKNPTNEL